MAFYPQDVHSDEVAGTHASQEINSGDGPIAAPTLDRRKDAGASDRLQAEAMYVREYDRGRVVRNTPIQRQEVLAMLASLIGENQAISKRKVWQISYRSHVGRAHVGCPVSMLCWCSFSWVRMIRWVRSLIKITVHMS